MISSAVIHPFIRMGFRSKLFLIFAGITSTVMFGLLTGLLMTSTCLIISIRSSQKVREECKTRPSTPEAAGFCPEIGRLTECIHEIERGLKSTPGSELAKLANDLQASTAWSRK